ncbi:hypothetical protein MHYP_G00357410 [Metynnis hypsauchen]
MSPSEVGAWYLHRACARLLFVWEPWRVQQEKSALSSLPVRKRARRGRCALYSESTEGLVQKPKVALGIFQQFKNRTILPSYFKRTSMADKGRLLKRLWNTLRAE